MRLTCTEVRNFRTLEDVVIKIDPETTLVVGRNNSGKTSFVNLFERFFGAEKPRFTLDDLSAPRIPDIAEAINRFAAAQNLADEEARSLAVEEAREYLPEITLLLTVAYSEEDSLASITDMILDLDENCFEVKVEAAVAIENTVRFLEEASQASAATDFDLIRYLSKVFPTSFAFTCRAIGVGPATGRRVKIDRKTVCAMLSTTFVYAQNKFDDTTGDRTGNLSKTFEAFWKTNSEDGNATVEQIEHVLEGAVSALNENYSTFFSPFLTKLSEFGADIIDQSQRPQIVSEISPETVLERNTRIKYPAGESGHSLPEGHNGLGYSKLIYTLLRIAGAHEVYKRAVPKPAIQLLFIEEPEAHLHPQMQETFIRNLRNYIASDPGWNVQIIITTHSSHIVAAGDFTAVRYFAPAGDRLIVQDLENFRHRTLPAATAAETFKFLAQHMVLHRCDMFFASKVILVEGTTERLLMRQLFDKCATALSAQYVSVIEVGGAYALRFRELLHFLGIKTLVITDLDSVDPADRRRKCHAGTSGAVTSNQTLRQWLPGKETVTDLLSVTAEGKEDGNVRVTYQVPEEPDRPCGRTFEDAFILANAELLAKSTDHLTSGFAFEDLDDVLTGDEIVERAWDIAQELKKTDFAFDLMFLKGWTVPRYLREGLEWLS